PTAHALGERGREGADPSGAPGDGAPWTAKAAASPRGTPAQVPPAPTFVQTTSKRDAAEHRSDTDRSLPRIDLRFSPRRAAQPTIAPAPTTAPTTHTGPSEAGRPRPRDLVVSPAEDTYASSATSPSISSDRAAHRPSHRPDVRSSFTAVHVPASHPTGADEVGPPGRSLSTPATQRTSPAAPGRGTGGRGLRGQARADVAAARRDATSDPRAVLRSTNDAGDRSDDDVASSDPVRRGATTPETGATSVRTKVAPTGPAAGSGPLGRSVAALLEPAMDHEGAPVGGPRDGILEAEIDDPDLGRLRVRIRRDDGEVHVRIFVDDPNLRRLADARIADLRATLRQSSGTEVTVDVAADGDRRNRDTDTDDPVRRPPVPATLPSAPAPASPSPGATGGADPRRMVDAIV
ncbi:MAG: flagellar hook-length control protein FliK, partial [Deltaproteobacteria bacterium]